MYGQFSGPKAVFFLIDSARADFASVGMYVLCTDLIEQKKISMQTRFLWLKLMKNYQFLLQYFGTMCVCVCGIV